MTVFIERAPLYKYSDHEYYQKYIKCISDIIQSLLSKVNTEMINKITLTNSQIIM